MLDICYNYRVTGDILFNPVKFNLITLKVALLKLVYDKTMILLAGGQK